MLNFITLVWMRCNMTGRKMNLVPKPKLKFANFLRFLAEKRLFGNFTSTVSLSHRAVEYTEYGFKKKRTEKMCERTPIKQRSHDTFKFNRTLSLAPHTQARRTNTCKLDSIIRRRLRCFPDDAFVYVISQSHSIQTPVIQVNQNKNIHSVKLGEYGHCVETVQTESEIQY